MTRFQKQIRVDDCERILKVSLDVQTAPVDVSAAVVIDSTVQEKHITYPTFAKLDARVANRCRVIAQSKASRLRQTLVRVLGAAQVLQEIDKLPTLVSGPNRKDVGYSKSPVLGETLN